MSSVALTGSDTIILYDRLITDLADGDVGMLDFGQEIATLKTGKNGNSIYSLNETGRQADLTLRIVRGSPDDIFLNGKLAQQQANFAGTILAYGQFIKKIGDGKGEISSDTYNMGGGIYKKMVGAKSNAEGDTEQSVSVYVIGFSNAPRAIV